jgi:hypothetical protein
VSSGWCPNRVAGCFEDTGSGLSHRFSTGHCESRREALTDYLASKAFVSSTQLRRFAQCGLVASQLPHGGIETGFAMGDAFHSLVLEPDTFSDQYLVLDDIRPRQPRLAEEEAMQRQWLDARQWSALRHARDALLACRQFPIAECLSAGAKELSIYWRDETGAGWKARPDCFTEDIVLDLKTTRDCRPRAFGFARKRFGYDLQAAHYVEALSRLRRRALRFAFVAVELSPPYPVWVHHLETHVLDAARAQLGQLKSCYLAAAREAPAS